MPLAFSKLPAISSRITSVALSSALYSYLFSYAARINFSIWGFLDPLAKPRWRFVLSWRFLRFASSHRRLRRCRSIGPGVERPDLMTDLERRIWPLRVANAEMLSLTAGPTPGPQ